MIHRDQKNLKFYLEDELEVCALYFKRESSAKKNSALLS